jgi:hypothetical protein
VEISKVVVRRDGKVVGLEGAIVDEVEGGMSVELLLLLLLLALLLFETLLLLKLEEVDG